MGRPEKNVLPSWSVGIFFLLLSISIISVAALVYVAAQVPVTKTVQEIATITSSNAALGNIFEGETIHYTTSNQADLHDVISVITPMDNVHLYLESDLDLLRGFYTLYDIYLTGRRPK